MALHKVIPVDEGTLYTLLFQDGSWINVCWTHDGTQAPNCYKTVKLLIALIAYVL
jgi:hypothetical protein